MNQIPVEDLKAATDPNLPFYSFKQVIGTAVITHDILNEFGMMCKAVIITNFDSTNNISVINKDPQNPVDIIPPSTKGEEDTWTSFIQLTPNAVTGNGILELQLVPLKDSRSPNSLASAKSRGMTPQQMAAML